MRQPDGSVKIINQQYVTAPAPVKPQDQKVQIIRGADGKLSVKGLVAGQQLIQMPDGKIHIVNTQGNSGAKTVVARAPGTPGSPQIIQRLAPGQTTTPGGGAVTKTVIQKIVTPGQPNILTKTPQGKLIASKVISSSDGSTPTTSASGQAPRVVTTSLQQLLAQNPGQKIVLNQGTPNQRILVATNSPQVQQQQQPILVQQPGGQVVQQILLNSGQRIIAGTPTTATTTPVKTIIQPQPVQINTPQQPQIQYQIQQSPATPVQQQPQTNGSIAQQLASGKLRMVNYNGQQVIVKPLANNSALLVAHVKQQEHGPAQIIVTPQGAAAAAGTDVGNEAVGAEQLEQGGNAEAGTSAGGPITKSITAQILQTPNGPRIVLQGLGQDELSQQQLAEVQQQVKQQLMKGKRGIDKGIYFVELF